MATPHVRLSKRQRKIILVLLGGVALGLSGSPKNYFEILEALKEEWKTIDERECKRTLYSLQKRGYLSRHGARYVLTVDGMKRARMCFADELTLPRNRRWDGKWRMVLSDIPETHKRLRDVLRFHLRRLGFKEVQKSVWIYPYDCYQEIEWLFKVYGAVSYMRYVVADEISGDEALLRHFQLA